ncbi:MAG: hypothetical protein AAF646_15890 [Pseudomonadota bacterium]
MVVSTLVKLKTLGLAKQVVAGAFINGALIGFGIAVGATALASAGANGRLCSKMRPNDKADTPPSSSQGA